MRIALACLRATWRQLRSPGVLLSTLAALMFLALIAALVDFGSAVGPVSRAYSGSLVLVRDVTLLDDLLFAEGAGLGLGTALATIAALVLFAFADAALALVSAGHASHMGYAWGIARRRAGALLGVTLCGLTWLAFASLIAEQIIRPGALWMAGASGASELKLRMAAELIALFLLMPGMLTADRARLGVVIGESGSPLQRYCRSLRFLLVRPAPWLAWATALALEWGLVVQVRRYFWVWDDPRRGLLSPLVVITLVVLARLMIHSAYLGGLAATFDDEADS